MVGVSGERYRVYRPLPGRKKGSGRAKPLGENDTSGLPPKTLKKRVVCKFLPTAHSVGCGLWARFYGNFLEWEPVVVGQKITSVFSRVF